MADPVLDRVQVIVRVDGPDQAELARSQGADLIEYDGDLEFPEHSSPLNVVEVPIGDSDEMLAFASVAAWRGAEALRTTDARLTRKVVEMVASIAGTRPPARAIRALA
ncbi:hypothetical protein Lesp02_79360 [Lentzea sp. NBRC 105346]|uniref:hypothetical protein n=1 Tax=Lentzea sp. NBRC 105346 TaxID=3032205 RepID=UPI0024A43CF0|nr:hypothetical protein [Lentzea sp. NBRC 105346]GLZ35749.1 hypothetical protein Lesp02_79360 [Lentzea sp. NBRC 105346]